MIFLPHISPLLRLLAIVPPLCLLAMILDIYFTYASLSLSILDTSPVVVEGTAYTVGAAERALSAVVLVLVTFFFLLLLLSFARAVLTDPGSVPPAVAYLYRGLKEEFLQRQQLSLADPSGLSLQQQQLPPQLRGIGGASYPDSDEEEGGGLTLLPPASAAAATAVAVAPEALVRPPLPGSTPWSHFHVSPVQGALPETLFTQPGAHSPRWCRRSQAVKPPRAHFCSVCSRLVLKMDHHCPWVGNCVGHANYKAFLLLLLHGWGATATVVAWWLPLATGLWQPLQPTTPATSTAHFLPHQLQLANARFTYSALGTAGSVGFVLSLSFLAVLTLFSCMHLWLVLNGSTTLEAQLGGSGGGGGEYSYSPALNWARVMGSNPWLWAWPVCTADVQLGSVWGTQWTAEEEGKVRVVEYPTRAERQAGASGAV